ncbi:MAG: isoprenylcysteine carboxylmethyltransferase family protein [Gemmatimonadota bacterium]|nr:isoprenylcysteine carboxylmethyltransferase family protein [Gemmatimonadota bacterium]
MTLSETAKTLRIPLGFILGIVYLALARPTAGSLLLGGSVALVGVLVRAWASGHITKNEKLATSGPYAHTRNPLYFGSFLIAAGFAVAEHWGLLVAVVAFFLIIYYPTMRREIVNISERFPETYRRYAVHVPLFFPRPLPWCGDAASTNRFEPALYMKHGEWKAGLTYVLAMIWLAFRTLRT